MYKSRQNTYSHTYQVWGNGQWFQWANDDTMSTNFSSERTCLSIDDDDTDTDFSRSKQQWRDAPTCHSIDGNKGRCGQVRLWIQEQHINENKSAVCVRTRQAGLRQRTVPTSKWRYRYQIFPTSKQQWREPLAFALLMVSKMRTSSIVVNSSTVCQMQKRASDMKMKCVLIRIIL